MKKLPPKSVKPMRFKNDEDQAFSRAFRSRVDAYFRESGKNRLATPAMWAKALFFLSTYWTIWSVLVFGSLSPAAAFALCLVFGFVGTCNALNISHDASHHTFTKSRWPNRALFWISMNQLGLFAHYWDVGHNVTHHYRANISGQDVAIYGAGVFRFDVGTQWKPWHRFQAFYAFFIYSIYTLLWSISRDWRTLREGHLNEALGLERPWTLVAELALVKILYFTYMLAIPMIYSPYSVGQVLVGFVAMHAVLSLYVAFTLFSSHMNAEIKTYDGEVAELPHSFVKHQFLTTCDFYADSRVANFFLGGFNAHVVHHLLPKVSSIHYPAIAPILAATAKEHGMPYLQSTLPKLFVSHLRFLAQMGRKPRVTAKDLSRGNKKTPTRNRAGVLTKTSLRSNLRSKLKRKAG